MLFSTVFATVPTNLKECCLELDKILSQEEKDTIKRDSIYRRGNYVYDMVHHGPLGIMIRNNWLYLPDAADRGGLRESELASLLIDHGAGF